MSRTSDPGPHLLVAGGDGRRCAVPRGAAGHPSPMTEMDPRDPSTLYSEGPVAPEPPEDDLPETSPLPDSGGTRPGPDDLDQLL